MADTKKAKKPQSFEKSLERLEAVVEKLESGEVDLEKAIELYEEGRRVGQECLKRLEELEKRVQIVRENAQGELETEDFEDQEDGF
ncbi:exodeoxyribonuclease VII small subunit [bacterium]|nr:exodeoxyribonuclease VII small subunit [bacterium]